MPLPRDRSSSGPRWPGKPGHLGEQIPRRQPNVLGNAGRLRQFLLRHPLHPGLRFADAARVQADEHVVQVQMVPGRVVVGEAAISTIHHGWAKRGCGYPAGSGTDGPGSSPTAQPSSSAASRTAASAGDSSAST